MRGTSVVKKGPIFRKSGRCFRIRSLSQCRRGGKSAGYGNKDYHSTAAAEVAAGTGDMAAIGSRAAAEAYDLEILREDIQDHDSNFTRFIVLGGSDAVRTGNDKTSLIFSTEDKPGSLYRILEIFNLWDINMTRIESRPARSGLGRYIFFVDVLGHREDDDLRDALTMVKRKASFLKILGSYPVSAS